MCSSAGNILPRPSDRKLRYVGGETRMVSIPRHIDYSGFLLKLTEIYGQDITLKYQLPEEDLDALVSVSSDEDLENMMEECDRLHSSEGSSRLRVFVFPSFELNLANPSELGDPKLLEQKYVDAVNSLPSEALLRSYDTIPTDCLRQSEAASVWNANLQSENLQSQASSLGKFVATGNPLPLKTIVTKDVTASTSPPHAASSPSFTRQSVVLEDSSGLALDQLTITGGSDFPALNSENFHDLECGGSASSSASSQQEIHQRITDSRWASPMQVWKESTPYSNGQDQGNKVEQKHIVEDRGPKGASDNRMHAAKGKLLSAEVHEHPVVDYKVPDNRDLPSSAAAIRQKQLPADWHQVAMCSDKVIVMDPLQQHGGFRQQQPVQEQQQHQWQGMPFYNPLASLGQETAVLGHKNRHSLEDTLDEQMLFPGVSQPLSEGTYGSTFQMGSVPGSPDRGHMEGAGKPVAFSQQGQLHKASTTELLDQEYLRMLHNYEGGHASEALWLAPQQATQPFLSPANVLQEELHNLENLRGEFAEASDCYSDGQPILSLHSALNNQQPGSSTFQAHGVVKDALPFNKQLHSPGPISFDKSLSPNASVLINAYAEAESEIEQSKAHAPLHVKLASPPLPLGEDISMSGLVVVPESSQQSRFADGLPVVTFSDGTGLMHTTLSALDHTISEDNSLPVQDSLFSKEYFPQIRHQENPIPYSSTLNAATDFNDKTAGLTKAAATGAAFHPAHFPAPTIAIEIEAEHVQHALTKHTSEEDDIEEMGLGLAMEKEVTFEDLKEIEELDRFESLSDKPSNAAALAEFEAISRGLQTIRNYDLEELRELGSGTFGTVYHGKWRGTDVAIKRIKSSCFTGRKPERERLIADFWREACILGQLHHPNVVAFYGVVPDGPGGTLATVTEYMVNGSLKQVLQKKDRTLDRRKRLLIAMDTAFGMEYLHGKNVVHFDIKCENLLVNLRDTQRPICKVGDLGLSKVKQQTMVSGGVRGTLPWMAPELLNGGSSLVCEKVDVFSFGIVLWELLTGEEPYANMHYGAIIGGIVNNTLRPPIPKWCDPAWKSLMEKCWSADPAERPTFSEIAATLRTMESQLSARGQGQALTSGS